MRCFVYTKQEIKENGGYQPADFILTHGTSFFDRLIQLMTMSGWNHVALITSSEGDIVEAVEGGIKKNHITKYEDYKAFIVRTNFSAPDQQQVIDYAQAMVDRNQRYGVLTLLTIALKILTKSRLIIKLDGTLICSEFVANALARGGVIWDFDTALITPADLYNKFVRDKKQQLY